MKNNIGRMVLNGLLDAGPFLVVLTATIISIIGLVSLVGVDVMAGQVTASHVLPLAPWWFHWFVSFATTGVLVATLGTAIKLIKTRWQKSLIWIALLLLVGAVIQYGDYRLDTVSVDVFRFGEIVNVTEKLTPAEAEYHVIFRHIIGAISLFGEPVAAVAVVIFPELRSLLDGLFDAASRIKNSYQPPVRSVSYKPTNVPTYNSKNTPQSQKAKGSRVVSPIFNDAYINRLLGKNKK